MDFDLDVKLSHVVFAVVASNLDLNWRLEKSLVELEQALLATSMPLRSQGVLYTYIAEIRFRLDRLAKVALSVASRVVAGVNAVSSD